MSLELSPKFELSRPQSNEPTPPKAPWRKPVILLLLTLVISFLLVPFMILSLLIRPNQYYDSKIVILQPNNAYLLLFLTFLTFYSSWGMYLLYLSKVYQINLPAWTNPVVFILKLGHKGKSSFQFFQASFILSLSLLYALLVIFRSYSPACNSDGAILLIDMACNPYANVAMFPMDTGLLSMSLPMLVVVILKEKRILLTIFSWLITLFGLIYSSILLQSIQTFPVVTIYFVLSALVMSDSFILQSLAFSLMKKLKEAMEVKQKLENEKKFAEMKDVIANVAHDLKTVRIILLTMV